MRQVADPLRAGWHEFQIIGRAAVADRGSEKDEDVRLFLYKNIQGGDLQPGDRLLATGDPLTADEMDLLRKEILGILEHDSELEDDLAGLMSFKFGAYRASLSSTSLVGGAESDTNRYKRANQYFLQTFGLRWWFFFNPSFGFNFDISTGSIPVVGYLQKAETSRQTYINPGLMYRSRLFMFPAIYSLTFFMNQFSTSNPDDFLINSTYMGANIGVTFFFPYRTRLLRLGPVTFSFNNFELGGGIAPSVIVSDGSYKRGEKAEGTQKSLNFGMEFNLAVKGYSFTNDVFFVAEGGMQSYDLSFSGKTSGTLASGKALPEGNSASERQTWVGVRVKYNIRDVLGGLFEN